MADGYDDSIKSVKPPLRPPPISPILHDFTIHGLFAVLSLLMGIVLIAGSPERISAPAYQIMHDYGGSKLWGAGFLSAGIFILVSLWLWPRWKTILRWAFLYAATAYSIMAAEFTVTAVQYPNANLTAMVVYGWVAMAHVIVSERIRREAWYWRYPSGPP